MPSTTSLRQPTRSSRSYFLLVRTSPSSAKYWHADTRRNLTKYLPVFGGAESRNAMWWAYMALCSTNSTTRNSTTQHEEMRRHAIQTAASSAERRGAATFSRLPQSRLSSSGSKADRGEWCAGVGG